MRDIPDDPGGCRPRFGLEANTPRPIGSAFKLGHADPAANQSFLGTGEMFKIKTTDYPTLADRYAAASPSERRALLDGEIAALPRPVTTGWTGPRHVDTIAWFASPADICRAFAGQREQDGVDAVLAKQGTAAPALDPRRR